MTSEVKSGYHDRIGLWMIVVVIILTMVLFFGRGRLINMMIRPWQPT